jgi:dUTP pyrophosphatase
MKIDKDTIYFSKTDPSGIVPTKRAEDAGFDLYACFDQEEIILQKNEIKLIPTGIATAFSNCYVLFVKERSSTGAIGLSVRMGVIDSGYRGEIRVGLNNTSDKIVIITKQVDKVTYDERSNTIYYPYSKGIAQAVLLKVPEVTSSEVSHEELLKFTSERMDSFLGASGK